MCLTQNSASPVRYKHTCGFVSLYIFMFIYSNSLSELSCYWLFYFVSLVICLFSVFLAIMREISILLVFFLYMLPSPFLISFPLFSHFNTCGWEIQLQFFLQHIYADLWKCSLTDLFSEKYIPLLFSSKISADNKLLFSDLATDLVYNGFYIRKPQESSLLLWLSALLKNN